jgi:hypothetical protein
MISEKRKRLLKRIKASTLRSAVVANYVDFEGTPNWIF